MTRITVKGVRKSFRDRGEVLSVLSNVDLNLESGSSSSLCGPSGSGKTTLLNIISGLDIPDQGEIWLDDRRMDNLTEEEKSKLRADKIGIIFQNANLISHLTAIENASLPLLFRTGDGQSTPKKGKAVSLLKRLGLEDKITKRPPTLSEGERRRVSIARALVNSPEIILADEPTINLDEENTKIVLGLLREYSESGSTLLVSTHDDKVAKSSDKTYRISFGKVEL